MSNQSNNPKSIVVSIMNACNKSDNAVVSVVKSVSITNAQLKKMGIDFAVSFMEVATYIAHGNLNTAKGKRILTEMVNDLEAVCDSLLKKWKVSVPV
jgi:hypoxanthine-guanine phosphoribosyltransferase